MHVYEKKFLNTPFQYHSLDTCVAHYTAARSSRVTSLLSGGDLLYVGTGGGAILVLESITMELYQLLHAYTEPVRSLLLVLPNKQSPPLFQRLFSRKGSARTASTTSSGSDSPINTSRHPSESVSSSMSISSEFSNHERAVLISFGVGYRGVIGEADNYPPTFMLPSEGTKNNTKFAKIPSSCGHLLLWSSKTTVTGSNNRDCTDSAGDLVSGVPLSNLCELEEDEESTSLD